MKKGENIIKKIELFINKYKTVLLVFSLALLLLVPVFDFNLYIMNIIIKIIIYIVLALGLNILVGYTGLVSLGQAGFVAIGAYTTAIVTTRFGFNFFTSIILAVILSICVGVIVALPTLRLTGTYLAIITLGFGEIVRTIIIVWEPVTNGPLGIRNIPKPSIFGLQLTLNNGGLYYLSLLLLFLVLIVNIRFYNSKTGRALRSIKRDETASIMMGISTTYYKVLAFVLSAIISAISGAVYSTQLGYIDQNTFTFDMSTMILSIVILGGMGTIRGMVLGSVILVILPEMSRSLMDYRFVMYGLILVLMMRFRPQGILGWRSRKPFKLSKKVIDTLDKGKGE